MSRRRSSFKNQDYNQLRNECFKSNKLFCDDFFNLDVKNAIWLRPKDIINDPKFLVGGASRFDVVQGANRDCWLVVAMANLTMDTDLFQKVVPQDQSFTDNYAGIFRFNIWQCGKWVEVVIDDRLPTKNGKLMFLRSRQKNEFWSALLEKAYAKLYGSYNELTVGWYSEAIVDLTGGVVERITLSPTPKNLGTIISRSIDKSSFMCVFMINDPSIKEMITKEGLVKGHAYSINKIRTVYPRNIAGGILLVRLRNPWGKNEWKGAWSDSSPEWQSIPSEERKKIGLVSDNDGEFWMSFKDFSSRFEYIDICHLSPDIFSNFDNKIKVGWESNSFQGEWIKNVSAGGFYIETFHLNPQYRITLTDTDDDEDELCTVIVALMQRNKTRKVWHRIGFTTFFLEGPEKLSKKPLSKDYIKKNFKKSSSSKFLPRRDNVVRDTWEPGVYCIIPSTYKPGEEGQFLLRVYSEKRASMEEQEISEEVSEPVVGMEASDSDESIKETKDNKKKENKFLKRNDQEIVEFFHKIAGNEGEIGWQGLQKILEYALNNAQTTDSVSTGFFAVVTSYLSSLFGSSEDKIFTKDECRNMIAMLDDDVSGKLSFGEFQILLNKLRSWESAFLNNSNASGYVDAADLNKALREIGYQVKNSDVSRLVRRYSDNNGKLAFDDYVMCAIELIRTDTS